MNGTIEITNEITRRDFTFTDDNERLDGRSAPGRRGYSGKGVRL